MSRQFIAGEIFSATFGRLPSWQWDRVKGFMESQTQEDLEFFRAEVLSIVFQYVDCGALQSVIMDHVRRSI